MENTLPEMNAKYFSYELSGSFLRNVQILDPLLALE